jgi:hypothetical protein
MKRDPTDQAETDRYWREVIVPRVAAARAGREHVLVGREDLVSRVEALLFCHDPIGINFDTNTDEYRPEAHRQIAGPVERYRVVAESIWGLWTAGGTHGRGTPR